MKRVIVPWWLCALLAIFFYMGCKYLPPAFLSPPWDGYLPRLAPLGAMAFLLYGAAMLYEGDEPTTDDDECDFLENDQLDSPGLKSSPQAPPKRDESPQE